jgi:chromosome segregation ATPase
LFLLSVALSWVLSSIDGERQKEQILLQESYSADLERKVAELEKQLLRSQVEHAEKEALTTRLGQSENALLIARAQERDLSARCEHLEAQLAIESNTSEYEFNYQHAALEEQLQERTQALESAEKALSAMEDRLTVLHRTAQEEALTDACMPTDLIAQMQTLAAQIEQLESHIQELEEFVSLLLPFARTKLC